MRSLATTSALTQDSRVAPAAWMRIARKPRDCGRRALALVQIALLLAATSCDVTPPLAPAAGLPRYQERLALEVPGAQVNLAGGNLIVRRRDLSIDTRIGELALGAVYNSTSGEWLWSFDVAYDGASFVDPTGAVFDVAAIPDGQPIPGTRWIRSGAGSIQTRGGLVHEFDAEGRLSALHWSSSEYPRVRFLGESVAGQTRTTTIDQCRAAGVCEPVHAIVYDAQGRVVEIDDRAGRRAEFAYDGAGRLVVARDALDVVRGWPGFRYEYDGARLTALTNSEGERVEYAYLDGRVRSVTAIGQSDPAHAFAYSATTVPGLYVTLVRDPRGFMSTFRYDAEGRLHEHENGSGDLWTWSWEGLRPASLTDPAGIATRWTWVDDELASATLPSGDVVLHSHAPAAVNRVDPDLRAPLQVSDSLGLIEQRVYDAQGRLVSHTNGAGETHSFAYDAEENLASITDPAGVVTRLEDYGEHGHARLRERGGIQELREFDAVGNLSRGRSISSPYDPGRPGIVSRSFDEDRNLSALELSSQYHLFLEAETLVVEHRSDGRRLRVERPYGGDTEFIYDALGRLGERREWVDGQWSSVRFEYDAAGNRLATELANGMRRDTAYNAANRPAVLRHSRNGFIERQVIQYWKDGRVESRYDSSLAAPDRFEYDATGRVVRHFFGTGGRAEIAYDLRSRETQRVLMPFTGEALVDLGWGYDAADRVVRVSADGQDLLNRSFVAGRLDRVVYGNGLERSFHYSETLGTLDASSTLDAGGTEVESSSLSEAACVFPGQMTCATWTTQTAGSVSHYGVESYLIGPLPEAGVPLADSGPRLVAWAGNGEPAGYDGNPFYEYDVLGNLLGTGDVLNNSWPFTFNEQHNRLLFGKGHSYIYDEAGFVSERDGVPLTWTAGGQIATLGDASFEWDTLGRPISSVVGGVERRFLFGGQVAATAAGQPLSIDLGEVAIDFTTGVHRYRHLDFRGNVKFVTDGAGDVVELFHYAPYGVDERIGEGAEQRSFAQGLEIGDLVLLGSRLYDPASARFLSPDPTFHLVNQYAYTMGNPVWLWDPSGEVAVPIAPGTGDRLVDIGTSLLSAGLATSNPALAVAGVVLIGVGLVVRHFEASSPTTGLPPTLGSPQALPGQGGSDGSGSGAGGGAGSGGGGGGSDSGGGAAGGCAPSSLVRGYEGPAPGLLPALIALQLLLGLALLRARQRSRLRPAQARNAAPAASSQSEPGSGMGVRATATFAAPSPVETIVEAPVSGSMRRMVPTAGSVTISPPSRSAARLVGAIPANATARCAPVAGSISMMNGRSPRSRTKMRP